jgi:hypothetical protein
LGYKALMEQQGQRFLDIAAVKRVERMNFLEGQSFLIGLFGLEKCLHQVIAVHLLDVAPAGEHSR